MKKGVKAFLWIVLVIIVLGLFIFIGGTQNMKAVRTYNLPEIDMSRIVDGEYEGACDIGRFAMEVSVTIKDHKIVAIDFIDGKNANANKELVKRMNDMFLHKNEPAFDTVTGATITSKAYMIAVTDALSK